MAVLISRATGNFTDASTWALCDPTSENDSETNSSTTTTSFVYSSTFTPGAITVDGLAFKFANVNIAQTGTFTVELFNNTDTLSVAQVVVNVNDFPNVQGNLGWHFFKFASSQTLIAGKAYKVGVKTSTNAMLTIFRDSTAGNWARQLRTTTTQAPAANDTLRMMGEHTGPAATNTFTITMDNTATTSFGSLTATAGMSVSYGATCTFGTAASTNYYLKWKGVFQIRPGGTLNVGTSGAPIPSTSTAVLEMDSTVNVDTGIEVNPSATFNCYGATKTNVLQYLTVDKAAAATTLTLTDTTGWEAGDELGIASTTRTPTECEKKTILTVDSGTNVTLTAGLTSAHSGTSPIQAEVINLTRNVKIRGMSTSLQGYIVVQTTSIVNVWYTEMYFMGSAVANKKGFNATTTTGSCTIKYCSYHDNNVITNSQFLVITGAASNNINFSYNVAYNLEDAVVVIRATTGTNLIFDNNVSILNNGAPAFNFSDIGGTITNNISVGDKIGSGFWFGEVGGTIGTISNNIAHSNQTCGFSVGGSEAQAGSVNPFNFTGTISNCISWRNNFGFCFCCSGDLVLDNITTFGNTTANMCTLTQPFAGKVQINNSIMDAGVTLTCPRGLMIDANVGLITLENTTFGNTTTHSTGDIDIDNQNTAVHIILNNCKLNSPTELSGQTNLTNSSFVSSSKHDQTNGLHKTFKKTGTISIDTIIYDVSPSQRLTPNNSSLKLESGPVKIPVASGGTVTPSVKVRHSVVGDGTAYNGNFVRLIVKKNAAAGISSDTVLATSTISANGNFETISGTTVSVTDDAVLTFVVDCDGTTGWVNIDSWSAI